MTDTGAVLSQICPPTGVSTAITFFSHGKEYLAVVRVSLLHIYELQGDRIRFVMSQGFAERILFIYSRVILIETTGAEGLQILICFDSHKSILYEFSGLRLTPLVVYDFTLAAEENVVHEQASYSVYDDVILVCVCGAMRSHIGLAHLDTGNTIMIPFIGEKICDLQCLPRSHTCGPQLGILTSFPIPAQRWARNARAGHLHIYTIDYNRAGSLINREIQRDAFTLTLQHKISNIPSDSFGLTAIGEPLNIFLIHSTRVFVLINVAERISPPLHFRFSFLPEEQSCSNQYIKDAILQCAKTSGSYLSSFSEPFVKSQDLKLINNRLLSTHNSVLTMERNQLSSLHHSTLPIAPALMPAHPFKGGADYPYYGYSVDRPDDPICLSQITNIMGCFPGIDLHLYMEACGSAHIDDLLHLEGRVRSSITPGEYINMSAFGKYPSNMEFLGPRSDVFNYLQIPPLNGTRACYLKNTTVDSKGWHHILIIDNRGLSFILRFFSDNGVITKQKLEMFPICLCDRNAAITTGSPAMLIPPSVLLALAPVTDTNTSLHRDLKERYDTVVDCDRKVDSSMQNSFCTPDPCESFFSARVFVGSLTEDSMLYTILMSTTTPKHGYYYDYRPTISEDESLQHGNLQKLAQALCASLPTGREAIPSTVSNPLSLAVPDASFDMEQIYIFGQPFNVEKLQRSRIFANAKLLRPFSGSLLRLIERQTTHLPMYDSVMHGLVFPYALLPSLSSVTSSSAKPVGLDDQKDANARPRLHLLHEAGAISIISSYVTSLTASQFKYIQKLNKVGDRTTALLDDYTCGFYHMNPGANSPSGLKSLSTDADSLNFLITSRVGTSYVSIPKDIDLLSSVSAKKDFATRQITTLITQSQPTLLAFTLSCKISVQVCPQEVILFVDGSTERISLSICELVSQCKPRTLQGFSEQPIIIHSESDYVKLLFLTTSNRILCLLLPDSKGELSNYKNALESNLLTIYAMTTIEGFCSTAFLPSGSADQLLNCLSETNIEASAEEYLSTKTLTPPLRDLFMKRMHALVTVIQTNQELLGFLFTVMSNARIVCIAILKSTTIGILSYIPFWVWQVFDQNFFEKDCRNKISFRTNTRILPLLPYICDYGVFESSSLPTDENFLGENVLMNNQSSAKDSGSPDKTLPYNASYIAALYDTQREIIGSEVTPDGYLVKHTNYLNSELNARRISSIYVTTTAVMAQSSMAASGSICNLTIFIAYFGGHTSIHAIGSQIDAPHRLCVTTNDSINLTTQPVIIKSVDSTSSYEAFDLWAEFTPISIATKEKTVSKAVPLRIGRPFRPIYLLESGAQSESSTLPLIFIGTPRPTTGATPVSSIAVPNLNGAYSIYILGRSQSYILLNKRYSIPIQNPIRQMLPLFYTSGCAFPVCLDIIDSSLPLALSNQGNCPTITSNFTNMPYIYMHKGSLDLGGIDHIYFGTHLLYKGVCEKEYKDMIKNRCFLHRRLTHARKNIIHNLLYLASFGNNTQMPVRLLLNLPPGLKGHKMCYHNESDTFVIVAYTERYELRNPRSVAKDEVAGIKVSEELKILRDHHRIGDVTEEDIRSTAHGDGDNPQLEAYLCYKEEGLKKAKEVMLASPPTYNSFMKTKLETLLLIANDPSMNKYRICDYYLYDTKRCETSTTITSDVVDSQFPRRFGSTWRHDGGVSRDDFGCINRRNYHNSQSSDQTGSKPREVLRSGSKELVLLGTGYLLGPDEKCYGTCKILAVEKADKNDYIKANKWNLGGWSSFFAFRLITQEEFQNVVTAVRSFPTAHVILIGENKRICAYHLEDSRRLTCCSIFERCGYISNISRFNEFISISDLMLRNGLYIFRNRGSRNNPVSYSSNDLPIYLSDFLVSGVTKEMNVMGVSLHRLISLLSYPYTKTSQKLVSQLAVQSSCRIPWTCVSILQVAGWVSAAEADSDRSNKAGRLTSNANCAFVCAEGTILVAIPVPVEMERFIEMLGCFKQFDIGPHCLARKKKSFDKKLVYEAARLILLQTLDGTSRDYSGLGPKAANIRNFNNLIWRLMNDAVCF